MSELFPHVRVEVADPVSSEMTNQFPELHPVVLSILTKRGVTNQAEIDAFLSPEYSRDVYDPFLLQDMQIAVDRIVQARDNDEVVLVYGDYDADGVCSSALMYDTLQEVGIQQLSVYLPHRDTEGYGLNMAAIEKFHEAGVQLIVTVDCGISNKAEVARAAELGIDVIVTDHHAQPPELPDAAVAIINPMLEREVYPFKPLAGVGVAFKVAQALNKQLQLGEGFEKWLLDLVAISTVTDCMPLVGENRTLLHYGLVVLNKTRRPGLRALIDATHKPDQQVDSTGIGFRIGPWINAAGRINHANVALQLLLEEDPAKIAEQVEELKSTNDERRALTETMFKEALAQVKDDESPIVVAKAEDWPQGLVGLVAGKLVSALNKPAFVVTKSNGEWAGSGRSVEGLNMIGTLQQIGDVFAKYGGHIMACGFTLKDDVEVDTFAKRFSDEAQEILSELDDTPVYAVDAEMKVSDITWELAETLDQLAPFGQEHPVPLLYLPNTQITDMQAIGANGAHARLVLNDDTGKTVKAIAFGMGGIVEELKLQQEIHVVAELGINHWNGNSEIQLVVKHIQPVE